jgi:hypothetical protein
LAAANLEALEAIGVHGPWFEARRASIRAGLAALDGHAADALVLYRDALRQLHDVGVPLDEALTATEMATLLDLTEPEDRAAADTADEILTRLGAKPFLARLEAAMQWQPSTEVREPAGSRETSAV